MILQQLSLCPHLLTNTQKLDYAAIGKDPESSYDEVRCLEIECFDF